MNESPRIALSRQAARIIRLGGVVIAPTETFYCLAVDPFNMDAVQKVYLIKARDSVKPLPLIAAGRSDVERVADLADPASQRLANHFWPGSLTMLLRPKMNFPAPLLGPDGKIGVRVPPESPARDLAELSGGLITATSANLSGEPAADTVEKIAAEVIAGADFTLDLGKTPGGKPSTLVNVERGAVLILREGAIPGETVRKLLG